MDRANVVNFRVNGMTDWRALAPTLGFAFPAADLDRIVSVLETLESSFSQLTQQLDYVTEPAITLSDNAVCGGISGE